MISPIYFKIHDIEMFREYLERVNAQQDQDDHLSIPKHFQLQWFLYDICQLKFYKSSAKKFCCCFQWEKFDKFKQSIKKLSEFNLELTNSINQMEFLKNEEQMALMMSLKDGVSPLVRKSLYDSSPPGQVVQRGGNI